MLNFEFELVNLYIFNIKFFIDMSCPEPKFIIFPTTPSFSAAKINPSIIFSTKLNSLVCLPYVDLISFPNKQFIIISGIIAFSLW